MNIEKDASEAPNLILISDPVAGFGYALLAQTGIAQRHKLPEDAASPGVGGQPQRTASSASQPAQDVRPQPAVEDLGTQQIEGLVATGTRIRKTIPAGMDGNDRALTVVWEIWRSQDMGITLLEKRSDPRSGDTETRVINLARSEPDAALFLVPADDTIKDP